MDDLQTVGPVATADCEFPLQWGLAASEFPRSSWIIEAAVVLCQGLLKKHGMTAGGRRSKLGSLHGPMNDANINGTYPELLAAQRFNLDVKLPY